MGVAYWATLVDPSRYECIDIKFSSDTVRYFIASSIPQTSDDDLFRAIDMISIFAPPPLLAIIGVRDVYCI